MYEFSIHCTYVYMMIYRFLLLCSKGSTYATIFFIKERLVWYDQGICPSHHFTITHIGELLYLQILFIYIFFFFYIGLESNFFLHSSLQAMKKRNHFMGGRTFQVRFVGGDIFFLSGGKNDSLKNKKKSPKKM